MAQITKDTVNVSRYVMLFDVGGSPKTGHTITDLDLTYVRAGALPAAKVDATALGSVDAAHENNKAIEVDATNMPGMYRVDWPDAAFAAGVNTVLLYVKGTDLQPCAEEIELIGVDLYDGVRGGMTALPNVAADAAGGLPISDAGGLDLDTKLANTHEITAVRMGALTDWINGGRLDLLLDAVLADTGTDGVVLATDAITAAKIATDAFAADEFAAAACNKIADHIIRRTFENACDSANGDAKSFRSLLGAIAKLVNKLSLSGTTLTVTEDDDTTTLGTQTVTKDATAEPITAMDTV